MRQLVRYPTGEYRVEDRDLMRCSQWLNWSEIYHPVDDFNLDETIGPEEPMGRVIYDHWLA